MEPPWLIPAKKFKRVSTVGKVMVSIFSDIQGVIMVDYLEEGRTISCAYYTKELRRLRQEIMKKRRGNLSRCVLLLQDNAPVHTSQVAMVLPHPTFSPYLAPSIRFQI